MKTRDLVRIGIEGPGAAEAQRLLQMAQTNKKSAAAVLEELTRVGAAPVDYVDDATYGPLARLLVEHAAGRRYVPRSADAPYRIWGEGLEEGALEQMRNACRLPVAVAGALMPDAHVGYGLPIGGVLATRERRHPVRRRRRHRLPDEAVGARYAGWTRSTASSERLDQRARARDAVRHGRELPGRRAARRAGRGLDGHAASPRRLKDKAWAQLGTSGSGNHFVEFGTLTLRRTPRLGFDAGRVSRAAQPHRQPRHRRAGRATTTSRAGDGSSTRELPQELRRLAWLDLDTRRARSTGPRWKLMGQYAAANHAMIHRHVAKALGARSCRRREPSQLRLERATRRRRPERRGDRPPQGRDAGRRGRAGRHPRLDGRRRASSSAARATPRRSNSAAHGAGRAHEPHEGQGNVHAGRRASRSSRARRHAALGRHRRSADGLQGHRRRSWPRSRIWSTSIGPLRSADREDGAERREAGGLQTAPGSP